MEKERRGVDAPRRCCTRFASRKGRHKECRLLLDTIAVGARKFNLDQNINVCYFCCACESQFISRNIWRVLTWSFFWLSVGVWPEVDMFGDPYGDDRPIERDLAGTPLAGGLFAVIYSLKGDLDYFAKCLKLRHYNRNEMCDFCSGTRVGPRGCFTTILHQIACGKPWVSMS